jgi:subtilisin family serine protease
VLVGPAWGAEYLLAKTEIIDREIEIEEDNWVAGIEWADLNGADIVTSSLGYIAWYTPDSLDGKTALCTRAAEIAVSRGIVVTNAAGNNGPYGTLIAPADGESVISVGAVDRYGELAYISSRGPTADGRIKPELVAMGVDVYTVMHPTTTDYWVYTGTSYATPLVAGVCAQLLELHPDWTPADVRSALLCTATRHNFPDNDFGYGLPQALLASGLITGSDVLIAGYPNPFRDEVVFNFCPDFTAPARTDIYDVRGARIRTIFSDGPVVWNGTNDAGRVVVGGVYFMVFRFETFTKSVKVLLVR